jgi:UDP-N-acetylmuramoyl-tripeptide--D-alanyl-D-alanine ligase
MRIGLLNALDWMGVESFQGCGNVSGWSIDSRTVEPWDIFFALRGENHDGHDYLDQVKERGGIAIVDREVRTDFPCFPVDDTLRAMQRVARQARRYWGGKVVGVTGSAGKTSTKDICAHFLSTSFPTGKTVGNFNNHVGLPLSILRLPDTARVAVLELGMNHAGEIRDLAIIAEPDVAVVTNVGHAHIEFFKDTQGIALAKRELVEALPASGVAVLNADDWRVARFAHVHRGRTITYGIDEAADYRATNLEQTSNGSSFACNGVPFDIPLQGRHSVLNVLAGIACAAAFGLRPLDLVEAARTIPVAHMRGERSEHNGVTILNDAYNANPDAMRAMLDVLAETPARNRVAVLGEMLELGSQSEALHRDVGAYAAKKKIDRLIGIRGDARVMVEAAVKAGMPPDATLFFNGPVDAGTALRSIVAPGDAVLFKGSRGVRIERALETFLEAHG